MQYFIGAMNHNLQLQEMYLLNADPVDAIPAETVKAIAIEALDAAATKLERVQALISIAPQPLNSGLQVALFNVLASEDLELAVDIVIDSYLKGGLVAYFLQDRIDHIKNPEQLRRAVGVLAATAKEDFVPELLEEENYFAIHTYQAVLKGLDRLVELDYAVDEVRRLAEAITTSIRGVEDLDRMQPAGLSQLLEDFTALACPHSKRPTRPVWVQRARTARARKFDV